VIEIVHRRAQNVFELLEIQQQAGLVEGLPAQRNSHTVVVTVRLLALAAIVAQVVTRRKRVFDSNFEHALWPHQRK